MHGKLALGSMIALFFLASVSAFGQTEVKGMIKNRAGDTFIVNSDKGDVTVILTDDTVTKDDTGLFGLDNQTGDSVLIPGLKVDVDGTPDDKGRVVANKITVDGDDLETSEMIEAGLHPTAEQVAENVRKLEEHEAQLGQLSAKVQAMEANQNKPAISENINASGADTTRFMSLSDYDVKGEATLHFSSGSSDISKKDQEELKKLAQTATGLKGYLIEVTGFADSNGSAAMNTELSEARAKAVIVYLFQQGNIPTRNIVAPGAMGEYGATAPNETKAGQAENRKVEVKVLVNKGTAGS